jgi:DNA polymerase elongation subunit (family B)
MDDDDYGAGFSSDDETGFPDEADVSEPVIASTSVGRTVVPACLQGFGRPAVPEDFFGRPDGFSVMNIDVQYDVTNVVLRPLHVHQREAPRVLVYGVTPEGHSALIIVHGFYPYCYFLPAPEIEAAIRDEETWALHGPERLEMIRDALDRSLRAPDGGTVVLGVSVRWGKSIDGYTDENRPFLKVVLSNPESVGRLRTKTEPGRNGEQPEIDMLGASFESNIPFVSRYMIDCGMGGAMWTHVPHGKFSVRTKGLSSYAQIEVDVLADDLKNFSVAERDEVAETRAIYFDIEMAPEKADAFPDADHAGDQINMIACNLITLPTYAVVKRVVLALDKCTAIPDKQSVVLSFSTESDLLLHFCLLVRVYDPDWLFGYNSINFDMKSIITRIRRLGLDSTPGLGINPLELGRRRGYLCTIKVQQFESGAVGKMKYNLAKMHGRNQYDAMLLVRRDVMCRFKSYSLDAVTRALKVRPKGHMPYEAISILQRGRFQDELRRSATTSDWFQLMQVLRPEYVNDQRVTRLFWRPIADDPVSKDKKRSRPEPKKTVKVHRDSHPMLETWALHGGFEEDFPPEVMGPVWKIVHRYNLAEIRDGKVFWQPTSVGRSLIADYCMDDAICTTEIDQRRMYAMNHMELGRLCFIGMMPLLTQGQQVRIISVIMHAIQDSEYLIPYHRPVAMSAQDKLKRKKGYKGATVVSPFIRWFNGYEDGHIAFMDFSGLYPSIIIAFNICYSTWVRPEDVERYRANGVKMRLAPNGQYFVHESVRRGVLPSILETITTARGAAKKGIALAQQHMKELRALLNYVAAPADKKADCLYTLRAAFLPAVSEALHPEKGKPMSPECAERCDVEWRRISDTLGYGTRPDQEVRDAILVAETAWGVSKSASDAKQNAIKVVANSVYGFTGAQVGKLPRQEVSSAVTAYGRMMIDTVIRMCESCATDKDGKERYAVDPEASEDDTEAREGISPYLIRVLYGDTDSAAAHLVGCTSVMEAWRLGKKIAAMLTRFFRRLAGNDAITLELEKVCDTELQMGKKRYAKREWKKNAGRRHGVRRGRQGLRGHAPRQPADRAAHPIALRRDHVPDGPPHQGRFARGVGQAGRRGRDPLRARSDPQHVARRGLVR